MSKQLHIILLIILMVFSKQNVMLSNGTLAPKIPAITYALTSAARLKNLTQSITQQITNNLKSEGFEAYFVDGADYPSTYDITMQFDMKTTANVNISLTQETNPEFAIFPYKAPLSTISPILETSYMRGSRIVFKDANSNPDINISATIATAIGLYSVGSCARMNYYLQPIIDQLATSDRYDQSKLLKSLYFYQGNCSLLFSDFPRAADLFEKALIYEGSGPTEQGLLIGSAVNLAWTYIHVGKEQKAIDLMTQLVNTFDRIGDGWASEPIWTTRYVQRAQIYNLTGHYAEALADLNIVLALPTVGGPRKAQYYFMRGQTYLLLYEWDNALADYNKALELDPTYADAYYYRGVLKYSVLQTGQSLYTEALTDFQKYLELSPDGNHAPDAARYATDIQTQLTALNN